MISKLVLGTAQFGLNYGINNKGGKPNKKEVFKILTYAKKQGVNILDTAYNYGTSEKLIGDFIKEKKTKFKIISKLPKANLQNSSQYLLSSLHNLRVKSLYAYLFHDFNNYLEQPQLFSILQKYKKEGLIENIGFSLYHTKELDYLFKKQVKFDIVQVPYSIFDQRFALYFSILRKKKIQIFVRSTFLQGLMFMNNKDLWGKFLSIKHKLITLRKLAEINNLPLPALAINFVYLNSDIDKLVIGVDSLSNLQEDIKCLSYKDKIKNIYDILLGLKINDENIINPKKWIR